MDNTGQNNITSGKELLEVCIEKLNENQNSTAGGNMALYPTVVVMLGEKSKKYTKFVKSTLDDNWNNARFLQYISLVKTGKTWSCASVVTGTRNKEITWENIAGKPMDVLNKAIVEMLQQDEQIFKDMSSIKMEFIMDATESESEKYFEFYLEAKNGLQSSDLKTLYLMLDQMPEEGKNEKTEKIYRYILNRYTENVGSCGTIYLLSNYLESGQILGENKIWQNYRLVADIILLGGNRESNKDDNKVYTQNLYNGIKTAAYALVPKPTDKIVSVSLINLMKEIYAQEERQLSKDVTEKDIRKRLNISDIQGLDIAEGIFRDRVQKKLPSAEDLKYLPFASEKEFKAVQKVQGINEREIDSYTMGVWSLLVQKRYIDVVDQFFANKEEVNAIENAVCNLLHEKFTFFEVLKMNSQKDSIKQLLQEDFRFKGIGSNTDYTEALHKTALYECKKSFYEIFKQILVREFVAMLDNAKRYKDLYAYCVREIEQESHVLGDQDASIEKVYANEVRIYVESHKKVNGEESSFPEVFDIRLSEEGLLKAFQSVYEDLIRNEIYGYNFEKELDFRMSNMPDVDRQVYVRDELSQILPGSTRLKTLTDIMEKVSCFYLISADADYAKQLAKREENGKDFMLFNLKRTDCVEQIEIYNVTKPESLFLNRQETNYDN